MFKLKEIEIDKKIFQGKPKISEYSKGIFLKRYIYIKLENLK